MQQIYFDLEVLCCIVTQSGLISDEYVRYVTSMYGMW